MALKTLGLRLKPINTMRVRPADKQADPFYLSPGWRRFIAALIAERRPRLIATQGHLCEDPECTAEHTPTMRIFGDHIVERQDGGADFDPANVMLRCGASHSRKTMQVRAQRARS